MIEKISQIGILYKSRVKKTPVEACLFKNETIIVVMFVAFYLYIMMCE